MTTKSDFSLLRTWVKKNKEADTKWDEQMKQYCSEPVKVTLTEKVLMYSVFVMLFGFITYMLYNVN